MEFIWDIAHMMARYDGHFAGSTVVYHHFLVCYVNKGLHYVSTSGLGTAGHRFLVVARRVHMCTGRVIKTSLGSIDESATMLAFGRCSIVFRLR